MRSDSDVLSLRVQTKGELMMGFSKMKQPVSGRYSDMDLKTIRGFGAFQ